MAKLIIVDDGEQKVTLIKESSIIQLQVENDSEEAYVNLDFEEVKALRDALDHWINKEVDNG